MTGLPFGKHKRPPLEFKDQNIIFSLYHLSCNHVPIWIDCAINQVNLIDLKWARQEGSHVFSRSYYHMQFNVGLTPKHWLCYPKIMMMVGLIVAHPLTRTWRTHLSTCQWIKWCNQWLNQKGAYLWWEPKFGDSVVKTMEGPSIDKVGPPKDEKHGYCTHPWMGSRSA